MVPLVFFFLIFRGGRWTSQWTITKKKIKGTLSVHLHYYEDGNVQFKADHTVELSGKKKGSDIASAVKQAEISWHKNLVSTISNLEDQFKSLRRILPMDKQTLNWNGLAHHKMGQELSG